MALVTRACGFIGSHVLDLLIEKGFEVRATDARACLPELESFQKRTDT
jgi:nucleoside-diphosphate-sugar epimerase